MVELLRHRGLEIENPQRVSHYIRNIGYYRLSAYMFPFLCQPKDEHHFKLGSNPCHGLPIRQLAGWAIVEHTITKIGTVSICEWRRYGKADTPFFKSLRVRALSWLLYVYSDGWTRSFFVHRLSQIDTVYLISKDILIFTDSNRTLADKSCLMLPYVVVPCLHHSLFFLFSSFLLKTYI